ncbi:MAG: CRISPR-associated protein Cas4 [Bilifractor sp.]|jgi:CRISPR-associated exonuclease Cas4
MIYSEDDYLMLSGIQHFLFCRRQWALIHVEQQWKENGLTSSGELFHKNAHDPAKIEKRGETVVMRGLRIHSAVLGISGNCDVVEFHRAADGITVNGLDGKWSVLPIEYKSGKFDFNEADAAQLCAEAMCLEEMLCCQIGAGALFWGETHRRRRVDFDETLRKKVTASFQEMHEYLDRGYTPKSKPRKGCAKCSLKDLCLPEIAKVRSVKTYISESVDDH